MQKGVAVALMLTGTAGPIWRLAHLKAPVYTADKAYKNPK